MKKTIITIGVLFFALLSITISANPYKGKSKTYANVKGHILDKTTQESLGFVRVQFKGTTVGTTTDATGHYSMYDLPIGEYEMEVYAVGYKTYSKKVRTLPNETLEINITMEKDFINLDEVVISANRTETKRKLTPVLVSTLNSETFEMTNSTTLSQGLKFQPGLRVEDNCQNCGFTQLRLNGLDGPYTQILIDSRPIYGALSGVYGLEQIPANMIERVEVVRGGGSALYGASAIGGTVNVITKEPLSNFGQFSHTTTNFNGSSSYEHNTTFNAAMVTKNHKAGIMIYGQNRIRDAYDHPREGYINPTTKTNLDGFSELPHLKNRSLGFRSYIKTGLYSKLNIEYHNMHEFRRGGDSIHLLPHISTITEQLEHYINGGSLNYLQMLSGDRDVLNVYVSAQHTLRKSYYGGGDPYSPLDTIPLGKLNDKATIEAHNQAVINNNQRLNAYGRTTELTYQLGTQYTHRFDELLFMPSELIAGVEYKGDELKDVSGYRTKGIDQQTKTVSTFLQNEWKNDQWSILFGGRLDKHNLVQSPIFTPRVNLRFNPTGDVNFRVSYSEGFRAPQYFDEDLHIAQAGGETIERIISKDLKEERSRSVTASIDYYFTRQNFQMNLLLEGFYTHLNNPFTLEDDKNNENIKYVVNASEGAKVYGINLEGRIAYKSLLQLQAGATIQRSLFDTKQDPDGFDLGAEQQTREFMRTPNMYGYFTAMWNPIKPFSLVLSGSYTGSMKIVHETGDGVAGVDKFSAVDKLVKTSSFFELNTKIGYRFDLYKQIGLKLEGGVQNIFNAYQKDFDTGAGRASTYIYGTGTPRNYFMGIKVIF